jgi:hypothetical protein
MPRLLLILDDDKVRLRGFDEVVPRLGKEWMIRAWRDAPTMAAEIDALLSEAQLISLDHDLYKDSPTDPDPGSGRIIANLLSKRDPVCPVILHSTNTDAAWGMFNELTSAKWNVEIVHHMNQPAWIEELWLPVAMKLAPGDRQRNAS